MLIGKGNLTQDSLNGEVVVVTGAGRGIGFETARSLAWLGANVVIAEIDEKNGKAAEEKINKEFGAGKAFFVKTDVGNETDIDKLSEVALKKFGKVDVVVNNATVFPMGAIKDTPVESWDFSYHVNLRGPVSLARKFLPPMIERKHGVFVCVSSSGAAPFMGAYEVFKTAQVELSNTISAEMEGTGVYAFTIGPGISKTPGFVEGGGKVASLMGMSLEQLFELNKNAQISPEAAGAVSAFSTGPPSNRWGAIMSRNPGDAIGSLTSHVMWTKPIQSGGVVGGNMFYDGGGYPGNGQGVGYYEGTAYEQRYINPIIMDGILYYMAPLGFDAPSYGPLTALNLQTGEVVWTSNTLPAPSFGYIYNLWNPDEHGTFPPILICPLGSTWLMVDGFTGTILFNVTGVPSGYVAAGPSGEQLLYVLQNKGNTANPNWYLAEWNSSKLWQYDVNPFTGGGSLSPAIINASTGTLVTIFPASNQAAAQNTYIVQADVGFNTQVPGTLLDSTRYPSECTYDWNVSIPQLNNPGGSAPSVIAGMYNNVLLTLNGTLPASPSSFNGAGSYTPYTYMAFDLTIGHEGAFKWINTLQPVPNNVTVYYAGVDPTTNVFIEENYETLNWVGYSLTTGQKIWGPTPAMEALDYYGQTAPNEFCGQLAFGNLYTSAFGGTVYCYDDLTGELKWTYGNGPFGSNNSTLAGLDTPYGDYPTFIQAVGSNGVIYLVTTEHTVIDPIYKGALARAINATTGEEIWTISDYTSEFTQMSYIIADGCTTFFNGYDGQIYTLGRGPSQTTVTAPNTGLASGQSVVIRGTVTDISAGTQQTQLKANFPNGVPVSSDAKMGDWMGYIYQQQPFPNDFTGVQVTIDVLDANGNTRTIGTATTDGSGMYTLSWKPDIPGNYQVFAHFEGTNGYWPSSSETSFVVDSEPTTGPTTAPITGFATASDLAIYMIGGVIAIIIAIAIVGLLILRKRP